MLEWCLDNHLYLSGDATYVIKEVLHSGNSILEKTPCMWLIPPIQTMHGVSSSETIKDVLKSSGRRPTAPRKSWDSQLCFPTLPLR